MCGFDDTSIDSSMDNISANDSATDDVSTDVFDEGYDSTSDVEAEFHEPMEFEDIPDSSIFDDVSDMSFEEQFEQQIDNMSLDELRAERENLTKMAELDDYSIEQMSEQNDFTNTEKEQQEIFDNITDDLSKEQLEELREKVIDKDKDVLNAFGYNDTEDGGTQKVLRR